MSITTSRFIVPPDVFSTTDKDGTTLLSVSRDRMFSLIGTSSIIWTILSDGGEGVTYASLVDRVARQYHDISRQQIEQDIEKLLQSLLAKRLLCHEAEERRGKVEKLSYRLGGLYLAIARRFTVFLLRVRLNAVAAFLALLAINLILKLAGFSAFYYTVKRWTPVQRKKDLATVDWILDGLDRAATWYPKQALCLQRSAAATCLLRSSGIPAEMVIGCRKIPFKAHAWVELDGLVVNDKQKVLEMYRVLDRL